jgi:hypothetical protein
MMKALERTLLACILCALAAALQPELRAAESTEESTIPPAPIKAALAPAGYKGPLEFDGKVMVVNRAEKTVTVDIQGRLHLFKMNPQVRILKKGKPVTIQDLAAGQKVTVVARATSERTLELVSLGVEANLTESEPTGRSGHAKGPGGASQPGKPSKAGKIPPPFQNGHYPGHVERVVVSPNN